MILEVASLNVRAVQMADFEAAVRQASPLIASMGGYSSHELQRCLESPNRYILLVHGERLEDHTGAFVASPNTRSGSACSTISTNSSQASSTIRSFKVDRKLTTCAWH